MTTESYSRDHAPRRSSEGPLVPVRALLLALLATFAGVVVLSTLLVGAMPQETVPSPGGAAAEYPPAIVEVPASVASHLPRGTETLFSCAG